MEKSDLVFEILDKLELTLGIAFLAVALFIWCMSSKYRTRHWLFILPIKFLEIKIKVIMYNFTQTFYYYKVIALKYKKSS